MIAASNQGLAKLVERHVLSWQTPLSQALPQLGSAIQPAYRDDTMIDMFARLIDAQKAALAQP